MLCVGRIEGKIQGKIRKLHSRCTPIILMKKRWKRLLNNWGKGAPKQMELLLSFLYLQKSEGEVTQPQLLKKSGASSAQLTALVEKNILRSEKRSTSRLPSIPKDIIVNFTLSPAQQTALRKFEKPCRKTGLFSSWRNLER